MELQKYKKYLDTLYFYKIECNIPDDESCVSIEEIHYLLKMKRSDNNDNPRV